jgi:NAD(P)-dependent dehydrogenase (short-subunit alcohol dehydrogenase family)
VARESVAAGGKAIANHASVATRAGAEAIVADALEHYGRIDVLINNAGNQRNGRIEQLSEEDFEAVLAVHLRGAFHVSQLAYAQMIKQRYGRLIFTSSASGLFGNYIRANYAAAKAGLIGLMHSFALEGAYAGVCANALLPTAASRLGQAPAHAIRPEWEAFLPQHVAGIERIGAKIRVEYVTPLVLYLASEACTSSHGMWSATGGRYARVFVGVTRGWLGPADRPATAEEIAAHLAQLEDRAGFTEPHTVAEELAEVARQTPERAG